MSENRYGMNPHDPDTRQYVAVSDYVYGAARHLEPHERERLEKCRDAVIAACDEAGQLACSAMLMALGHMAADKTEGGSDGNA